MTHKRPPDPIENNVKTFYRRPFLGRLTGHYTVEWENDGNANSISRHNRIEDMEGYRPSLGSLMRIPSAVRTYVESKRKMILKRPLPFIVFEAIDHLATLVRPGSRVLEFGGGNSTLWFLGKGARVTTIEHSAEWAARIEHEAMARFGDSAELDVIVAEGESALNAARGLFDGRFDVVLVDCMNAYTWRHDAVEAVLPKMRKGGTLCLDNSDHPNNWAAVSLLGRESRTRFTGYAPMCPVVTQTSFWSMD